MADPIKTLASRFVSLPYLVRMEIVGRLLKWRDEDHQQKKAKADGAALSVERRKSFMEQFWDEVEKTHNDGLYQRNPFTEEKFRFGF